MKHSIPEHSIRGDKYDYMCAAAYIYLNPISESYSTCSPTPHLEVGVYSKKKVAEGNLCDAPHLSPAPHLKLGWDCLDTLSKPCTSSP